MKHLFYFLLIIAVLSCKETTDVVKTDVAQIVDKATIEKEVLSALSSFDEAYKENQDSLFRTFLSEDIIVYGTDPTEVWPFDVFKNHIPDTKERNIPKLKMVKTNSTHISADGRMACIVRELDWKGVFDNTIRQTIFVEKDGAKWMVKMISLAHLLPNGGK